MRESVPNGANHIAIPSFIHWLSRESNVTIPGAHVRCFYLDPVIDEEVFKDWCLHIRRQYINDKKLEEYASFTCVDKSTYLKKNVIPETPQIRSGDFAEIVIEDLLEFVEGFHVSRYKHCDRTDKDSSEHGADVIGYRIQDPARPSNSDSLIAVEAKSQSSTTNLKKAIEDAALDSPKDRSRLAMTLNYHLRRSIDAGDLINAEALRRFLNKSEHPYQEILASGVLAGVKDAQRHLNGATASDLKLKKDNYVFIVHGPKLMNLIHRIYQGCIQ